MTTPQGKVQIEMMKRLWIGSKCVSPPKFQLGEPVIRSEQEWIVWDDLNQPSLHYFWGKGFIAGFYFDDQRVWSGPPGWIYLVNEIQWFDGKEQGNINRTMEWPERELRYCHSLNRAASQTTLVKSKI